MKLRKVKPVVASFGGASDAVTLVVSRENLHDEQLLRNDLTHAFGDKARLIDGLGAVSVVGAGINAAYTNVLRGSACLREHDIAVEGLATSSFRITWLVPRRSIEDAVRALHRTFLEQEGPSLPLG